MCMTHEHLAIISDIQSMFDLLYAGSHGRSPYRGGWFRIWVNNIKNWIETKNMSPMMNQTIDKNILIPNHALRFVILDWKINQWECHIACYYSFQFWTMIWLLGSFYSANSRLQRASIFLYRELLLYSRLEDFNNITKGIKFGTSETMDWYSSPATIMEMDHHKSSNQENLSTTWSSNFTKLQLSIW